MQIPSENMRRDKTEGKGHNKGGGAGRQAGARDQWRV